MGRCALPENSIGVGYSKLIVMKVLMLWQYYPEYLSYFYKKYPFALELPFEDHRNRIFDDHFGWPADLSRYMNQQGIQTEFIIANAETLQKKWAEENDFRTYSPEGWEKEIAMEQIKCFRPDILWLPSIFDYFGDFVRRALSHCKKVIAWVGSPWPEQDISGISVLLTENPNTFSSLQSQFERVIVTKPGFNAEIFKKIGMVKKKYDFTFVGSLFLVHSQRAKILAYLIKNGLDLKVWGILPPGLEKKHLFQQAAWLILKHRNFHHQHQIEIIKSAYQGPVFGLDMYSILAASRITLNIHGDIAGNHAGNMRMFEATGVGACLLTEEAENINDLFEPGKEILTYNSKEELLEIIPKMLNRKEEIERIAKAGQERNWRCHTLERMFADIQPAFNL